MNWFRVTMSNEDVILCKHIKLQDDFESLFMAAGAPRGAAMFANRNMARGNWFFFSPDAMIIARTLVLSHNAIQCTSPRRDEISLLVGHEGNADASLAK